MKLAIDAKPGELAERFPDLVKTLERMAGHPEGCDCLLKAQDHPEKDLAPLFPVLRKLLKDAGEKRDKIQSVAERKMMAVLTEAAK